MVDNPVWTLLGITASSYSKRFKVALLVHFVTLKILSYNIHSPRARRISMTILLLVTEYIFKPIYSRNGDSLSALHCWCIEVTFDPTFDVVENYLSNCF